MIQKKLSEITKDDIKQLVDNQVFEGKTLEYKSALPGNGDEDKKEFLADVSSLANTDGGDLIFGVFEDKKEIKAEFGIEIANTDTEIQRLENIIRDGISPRIDTNLNVIDVGDKKSILIIRIKPSLNSPHRVVFKNSNRFYKRNSNGKYEMDVFELKNAFGASGNLIDSIRDFRKNRIFDLKANSGPVRLENVENFLTVHVIPLAGVVDTNKLTSKQLLDMKEHRLQIRPLYASGWNTRINLDGVCAYSMNNGKTTSYTQVFRNGTVEGFDSLMIAPRFAYEDEQKKSIPMVAIERKLIEFVSTNLELLKKLEIEPPYFVFNTITGIKGYIIKSSNWMIDNEEIAENDIYLPEVVINDFEEDVAKVLKPAFDMVWNASGSSRSYGYDENGDLAKF
jgi:hypothetical protein